MNASLDFTSSRFTQYLNKNAFILHEDEDELRGTTSIRLENKALSVIDYHQSAL